MREQTDNIAALSFITSPSSLHTCIDTPPLILFSPSHAPRTYTFLLKQEKNTLDSVLLFIILSFCGANRGWSALGQTKMSSLHSNTRGIVTAHTCVHTQQCVHLQDLCREQNEVWLWERGFGEGHILTGPAQSSSTPVPTQTPVLSWPQRDHPPLAPLLIEHQAPRPLWASGGCSRATVWCGLRFRSLLGFKITHQTWGEVQEEMGAGKGEIARPSLHTRPYGSWRHSLFKCHVALPLPWWEGGGPDKSLLSKL